MKFNLKNRPKTVFKESSFTKWFEGFEKELRERLKQIKQSTLPEARIRREIYKEILGE